MTILGCTVKSYMFHYYKFLQVSPLSVDELLQQLLSLYLKLLKTFNNLMEKRERRRKKKKEGERERERGRKGERERETGEERIGRVRYKMRGCCKVNISLTLGSVDNAQGLCSSSTSASLNSCY